MVEFERLIWRMLRSGGRWPKDYSLAQENGIILSMEKKDEADIIECRFLEFTKKYNDVLEKHEEYVYQCEKDGEVVDETADWVEAVEVKYDELQRQCHAYMKDKRNSKHPLKVEESSSENSSKTVETKLQCRIQIREQEKNDYLKEVSLIDETLECDKAKEVIKYLILEAQKDLRAQLERCKEAHSACVALLS